jgi:Flp pilus assembly protein protease CpaA
MAEQSHRGKFQFDGKKLIPDILFINAIIYQVLNIQYNHHSAKNRRCFLRLLVFYFCIFPPYLLNLVGAKYYKLMPVALV